jgi:hypothetical protein
VPARLALRLGQSRVIMHDRAPSFCCHDAIQLNNAW